MIIKCPGCKSDKVRKKGMARNGSQRYQCLNMLCNRDSFTVQIITELSFDIRSKLENYRILKDAAVSLLNTPYHLKKESEKRIANLAGVMERIELSEQIKIDHFV